MKIETRTHETIVIVTPHGRLDSESSPAFERRIEDEVEKNNTRMVVDLSGITYMSSRGLRAILASAKMTQSKSGRLVLCCAQEPVQKIFDMTGVNSLIQLHHTTPEALASFENGQE